MTRRYFPLEPLKQQLQATDDQIAAAAGVAESTIRTWRRRGLDLATADRLAIAHGLHPALIWPDLYLDEVHALMDIIEAEILEHNEGRWHPMLQRKPGHVTA